MNTSRKYIELMIGKAHKLHEDGRPNEARAMFSELLELAAEEPQLYYHLGMLSMESHDNPSAHGYFCELVRLQPDFLEGRMLLGMTCAELGRHEEAVKILKGVLAECPDVAEIRHRLGLSLAELNRYEDAYKEYQEVLRIDPGHKGVLCSLGVLFTTTGQIEAARNFLLQALERDPNAVNVINNLGRIYKFGQAAESLKWYQRGLDIEPENRALTSNYLYTLNYVPGLSPEFIAAKYLEYASRTYRPGHDWQRPARTAAGSDHPVRIGYLSGDFYGHSVSFFLEPVMRRHDRQRFEIFCYSNRTASDETTERLKALCTGWRCIVGLSDFQAAEMIAADLIDVLVDLSGHTSAHRLGVCAYRPAPVQVSWIGHPNTTGLPQVDYYLTDAWCDPPGMTDDYYTERLYRLPRVFCCYQPPLECPDVAPAPSISSGNITFGCFNSIVKVNEELIALWAVVLREVPGSKIFVKSPNLDDKRLKADLLDCFERRGIDQGRIIVQGVTNTREEHLARYAMVDIALDSFPYHGTTTTCEALWMGVPVVTLAGKSHVSRVGASLLHAVGLDDQIAESPADYISKAVRLALDRQRCVYLRENLRTIMLASPLMDAAGVTREVEDAYLEMCARVEPA